LEWERGSGEGKGKGYWYQKLIHRKACGREYCTSYVAKQRARILNAYDYICIPIDRRSVKDGVREEHVSSLDPTCGLSAKPPIFRGQPLLKLPHFEVRTSLLTVRRRHATRDCNSMAAIFLLDTLSTQYQLGAF
jgi:hypothetical protein